MFLTDCPFVKFLLGDTSRFVREWVFLRDQVFVDDWMFVVIWVFVMHWVLVTYSMQKNCPSYCNASYLSLVILVVLVSIKCPEVF